MVWEHGLKPESHGNRTNRHPRQVPLLYSKWLLRDKTVSVPRIEGWRENTHKRSLSIQINTFTKPERVFNFFSPIIITCYCFPSAFTNQPLVYFIIDLQVFYFQENFKHKGQNTAHLLLHGPSNRETPVTQKKPQDCTAHTRIPKHFNDSNHHQPETLRAEHSGGRTKQSRGQKRRLKRTAARRARPACRADPQALGFREAAGAGAALRGAERSPLPGAGSCELSGITSDPPQAT